ncbi:MAG: hypothetical protein Hens3KO_19420 [Henriciella sp.]
MPAPETNLIERLRARFAGPAMDRLGFGCAHLYGGRKSADSLAIVAAAIDSGLTYFDTARLYGHGQSERILGQVLAGRRDKVIIASKVGILPAAPSLAHRGAAKSLNVARKVLPGLARHIPKPKPVQPRFGAFSPTDIRASVETSLRELRTDYLDILLLHECSFEQARRQDVSELLEQFVGEGKIRAYGIATQPDVTLKIAAERSTGFRVLQFKNDLADETLAQLPVSPDRAVITHSHLGSVFQDFLGFLSNRADAADVAKAGLDISDPRHIGRQVMSYALAVNKGGGVLFSSTRSRMIEQMAAISEMSSEAQAAMRRLILAFNSKD